jgi:citrate lyase subunit beta/citryl-CoA lyase
MGQTPVLPTITPPLDEIQNLPLIAPCEHIAGNEKFIRKAFELQTKHVRSDGRSLVDVTVDLEDGAPVGKEAELRAIARSLVLSPENRFQQVGVRIHSFDSSHFRTDIEEVIAPLSTKLSYITIPKIQSLSQLVGAWEVIQSIAPNCASPLHALIETPTAVHEVEEIAALPYVQVLDFGLMDFISFLGGGISASCMKSPGQFDHKILSAVKEKICRAALGNGKIPSHNVTVSIENPEQARLDALRARNEFGFLRMWSIHPAQVPMIIEGILPSDEEVVEAKQILKMAEAASWGPIKLDGRLHDRASYRYYWGVVSRSKDPTI